MVSDLGPVLVRLLRQPLLDRQHLVVQHHLVAAGCDDKLNLCILDFVDGTGRSTSFWVSIVTMSRAGIKGPPAASSVWNKAEVFQNLWFSAAAEVTKWPGYRRGRSSRASSDRAERAILLQRRHMSMLTSCMLVAARFEKAR